MTDALHYDLVVTLEAASDIADLLARIADTHVSKQLAPAVHELSNCFYALTNDTDRITITTKETAESLDPGDLLGDVKQFLLEERRIMVESHSLMDPITGEYDLASMEGEDAAKAAVAVIDTLVVGVSVLMQALANMAVRS